MTRLDAREMWRQTREAEVAELRAVVRHHRRDDRGRCAACVAAGLAYPGGHRLWPCDPHLEAVAELRRLGVDPRSDDT